MPMTTDARAVSRYHMIRAFWLWRLPNYRATVKNRGKAAQSGGKWHVRIEV